MSKSVIFQAETVEKAIEIGLQQLKVDRSQVDIEVISEPRTSIFGFPTRSAAVKLTLKKIDKEDKNGLDGSVWVDNGELKFAPPQAGGRYPTILFNDLIKVTYNGVGYQQRLELKQGIEPLQIILPTEQAPKKDLTVYLSHDKLKAYIHINRVDGCRYYLEDQPPSRLLELKLKKETIPAPKISTDEMLAKLKEAGVIYGFQIENLRASVENNQDEILAASGKPPVPPQDGYIEYEFQVEQQEPDYDADRIDYYELKPVLSVKPGDVLARKILGIPGQDGINVLGEPIPVESPKEPNLFVGEGVRLSDDQLTAYAERAGLPTVQNGVLKVLEVLKINSDANLETGNIRFNGQIIIRGNVTDQVTVQALSGGIQIYGMVDQAQIEAESEIIIKRNAIASEIKAGGMNAAYTRVASYLHELGILFNQLIQAFMIVNNRMTTIDAGSLIKNLIEIKFSKIPKMIEQFEQEFSAILDTFPPDFYTLMLELKQYFLDRGPLAIPNINFVQQLLEHINFWQSQFQESQDKTADVHVGYLQNSTINASGKVTVHGKGVYYSTIIAGKGYHQPRGVFRNSHVTVKSGTIEIKEMGSQACSTASAAITNEGKMMIGFVHPNVTVAYRNQKYQFLQPASQVKVLWHDDGIVVYSGRQKLS